jgi:hypothetical protein
MGIKKTNTITSTSKQEKTLRTFREMYMLQKGIDIVLEAERLVPLLLTDLQLFTLNGAIKIVRDSEEIRDYQINRWQLNVKSPQKNYFLRLMLETFRHYSSKKYLRQAVSLYKERGLIGKFNHENSPYRKQIESAGIKIQPELIG